MNKTLFLEKIKVAGLVGRGGGSFPTHLKWQRMLSTEAEQKYVVCNVSEGEPGVKKDFHILKTEPKTVFHGFRLALDFLETEIGYFYFNSDYWQKLHSELEPVIDHYQAAGYEITIFQEEPSYIGGETGALLNAIEGKRVEPRLKPPSPSLVGINGCPVLLHNVETLYNVSLVARDQYQNYRFYTVGGQVPQPGVYYLSADLSVAEVLQQTDNHPDFAFFAQVGGGASGSVWNQQQLAKNQAAGTGAIEVYPLKTSAHQLVKKWLKFYQDESCGKCAPCRQGTFQLYQQVKNVETDAELDWQEIESVLETLTRTAFCDLGKSLAIPLRTYKHNVLETVIAKD